MPGIPFWLLLMKSLTWLFYTHCKEKFCVNNVIDVVTSYSFSKEGFLCGWKDRCLSGKQNQHAKAFSLGCVYFLFPIGLLFVLTSTACQVVQYVVLTEDSTFILGFRRSYQRAKEKKELQIKYESYRLLALRTW